MILFPNCKINLGLNIIRKREDGFHNLQTIFYPLPLQDALEIITDNAGTGCTLTTTGFTIEGNGENICAKAYALLKKDFPQLPAIQLHLHKAIPIGAGLGGGSADGAFTLLLLNKKYHLNISEADLIKYALQLGSDCPFFIKNKPCIGTGRGEKLQEIALDLSPYKIVVVNPGIHINTGWAFGQITPKPATTDLTQLFGKPMPLWKEELTNDFEPPVFQKYPEIENIKTTLYGQGALYAAMSGTGSTVYGLFKKDEVPAISFPLHYFVKECYLAATN